MVSVYNAGSRPAIGQGIVTMQASEVLEITTAEMTENPQVCFHLQVSYYH
jgi:hypothetical protein